MLAICSACLTVWCRRWKILEQLAVSLLSFQGSITFWRQLKFCTKILAVYTLYSLVLSARELRSIANGCSRTYVTSSRPHRHTFVSYLGENGLITCQLGRVLEPDPLASNWPSQMSSEPGTQTNNCNWPIIMVYLALPCAPRHSIIQQLNLAGRFCLITINNKMAIANGFVAIGVLWFDAHCRSLADSYQWPKVQGTMVLSCLDKGTRQLYRLFHLPFRINPWPSFTTSLPCRFSRLLVQSQDSFFFGFSQCKLPMVI